MKQRIFSGIQPSGNLHIGNYLGAIKNWVKLQDEYDSIFCVVDLHAITVPQDPEKLRQKTIEIAKIYLAAGIDPSKCSIFIQSHVKEHAELMWILNTIAKIGELERMTQFKDKSRISELVRFDLREESNFFYETTNKIKEAFSTEDKDFLKEGKDALELFTQYINNCYAENDQRKKVDLGIFNYPVLMAADILLYNTNLVPVGEDQEQHVELARTLARRFNDRFGETFVIPESRIYRGGGRIMGLDNPTKKMSKSAASEYNYISLADDEETIKRKIKRAVTDSGNEIVYSDDKPALKNLLNIYSFFTNRTLKDIQDQFQGKGYADFKNDLAEVVVSFLAPFQEKMNEYSDEKVLEILRLGAEKVRPIAKAKLDEVKKKVGFII